MLQFGRTFGTLLEFCLEIHSCYPYRFRRWKSQQSLCRSFCPSFCRSETKVEILNLFIFIYFWLHWVSVAARGLSLVAGREGAGYSSLCVGFSLWWLLLLQSTGSRPKGFSSCGTRPLERRLSSCGAGAQLLRGMWDLPGPGLKPVLNCEMNREGIYSSVHLAQYYRCTTFIDTSVLQSIYLFSLFYCALRMYQMLAVPGLGSTIQNTQKQSLPSRNLQLHGKIDIKQPRIHK